MVNLVEFFSRALEPDKDKLPEAQAGFRKNRPVLHLRWEGEPEQEQGQSDLLEDAKAGTGPRILRPPDAPVEPEAADVSEAGISESGNQGLQSGIENEIEELPEISETLKPEIEPEIESFQLQSQPETERKSEMTSIADYEQLLEEQAAMNAKVEAVRQQVMADIIVEMKEKIGKFKITAKDLDLAMSPVVAASGEEEKRAHKVVNRAAVAPKYRNSETGATWSGRGKAPLWIRDVPDRSQYLIQPEFSEIEIKS
jgi:DNA-binding protein H-NS